MEAVEKRIIIVFRVKITKCSFPYMWYSNLIGKEIDVVRSVKTGFHYTPFAFDKYKYKALKNESGIDGVECWVLEGDYQVLGNYETEITIE